MLDQLEEEVASARKMPMGGGVLVDRKRMLELIDQLRVAIPTNIREARDIMHRREQVLAEANTEARQIVTSSQQEAQRLVSDDAIVREARAESSRMQREAQALAQGMLRETQQQADQTLEQAKLQSSQQRADADQYTLVLLTRLDKQISAFLGNVRQSLEAMQSDDGTDRP